MRILICALILIFIPIILGINWIIENQKSEIIYIYIMGLFSEMALFLFVCFPMSMVSAPFHILVIVYSIILIACSLLSIVLWKNRYIQTIRKLCVERLVMKKWERIYFLLFVVLFVIQLYFAVFYDVTYMSYDDEQYVGYAQAAIYDDLMYHTNITTGIAENTIQPKLWFQSYHMFWAYIGFVSGISTATIARTVFSGIAIVIAYGVYYLLAKELIKEKENQYIFLILLSVAYIFGYQNFFSVSFRLLGPNWQGKAILATTILPLLLFLYLKWGKEKYCKHYGAVLLLISVASVSLTLGGVITMAVTSGIFVLLNVIYTHDFKKLLYIIWANIIPAICGIIYLIIMK